MGPVTLEAARISFTANLVDFLWMALGVAFAVVFPWLRSIVTELFGVATADRGQNYRKAAVLVAFSAITGIIVLAVYRQAQPDQDILWYTALLAGFGWESTFEKLTGLTTDRR